MRIKSLRTKIILLTFVPTAIILATIALVGIYAYGQVIETQVISNTRQDIRLTAARLEAQIEEFENVLVPLARMRETASEDPGTRQAVLERYSEQLSVFDGGVAVLNTYGKVVAASPELAGVVGQDWSGYTFFQKIAVLPETRFSQMAVLNSPGKLNSTGGRRDLAVVAVPILKEYGEFAGILLGGFRLGKTSTSSFYGSIVKLHISPEKEVYLVDTEGAVLYHTRGDEIGLDYSGNPAAQQVAAGKTDVFRMDEGGQLTLVSFAPIQRSSWGLVVGQSWNSLLEPGLVYWRTLLALLLIGLLLPAVLVALSVWKVTEPIWVLNEAARQVGAGNLEQEVQVHSGDELEDLSVQFNQMSRSLVQSVERLKRTNRSLQVLSQCNQTLVHASDEHGLLAQICRIVVNTGGYQAAWVGFIQGGSRRKLLPAAWLASAQQAGAAGALLEEESCESGPVEASIRERKQVSIADTSADTLFPRWSEQVSRHGCRSAISLPLVYQEDLLGVMVIYSAVPEVFDEAEIALLEELAKDMAYGTASLRAQAERERSDAELAHYRSHLEELVEERTAELARLNQDLVAAKEAAEAADRIKSAFLATMSHELRTPLNSIIGFTGIMLQGLAGPLNDEQNTQLGFVQTSATHLLELINDVLDISKIEAGQLKLVSDHFNLGKSVEKMVQMVTPLANKKNLPVRVRIDAKIGEVVNDRRRLEQVLLNLLNNAVKFTEEGYIEVICEENGQGMIALSVCDTGIGIRPEQVEKIFKPFSQIDTGLTRKYEGTGLGLSISKKLIERMGGHLILLSQWDASTPPYREQGVGSTFTVLLPKEIGQEP